MKLKVKKPQVRRMIDTKMEFYPRMICGCNKQDGFRGKVGIWETASSRLFQAFY